MTSRGRLSSEKRHLDSRAGKTRQLQGRALLGLAILLPLAVLSGCVGAAGGQGLNPAGQAVIQAAPATVNFGSVTVGTKSSQTVSVTNTGSSDGVIADASLSSMQFSTSGISLPASLPAGQTLNFKVWFDGTTAGKTSATLTLKTSQATGDVPITLQATALPLQPVLTMNPASLSFGAVTVGTKSSLPVTLSNTGGSDLTISLFTQSGAPFGVSGIATPKTIPSGQSATMNVTYAPSSAGSNSGSVVITSNDSKSPATILLSGTATTAPFGQLTLSPASLNFGNVAVGGNSTLTSTLTNSGQAAANISQVNVTGSGFTVSGLTAPATLNPGNSVTLQVKYAPASAGAASGSVSILSDAQGSPTALALSGAGTQAGLSISPASISFGSVVDGQTKSQSVTLTNTGTANLTISQATLTGSGFSSSGLSTPPTILPGQSSSFSVQFAPLSAGTLSGSLALVSNAPNSPASIALSGTGVTASSTLSATPASVSFGNVIVGSSASQSVTVMNTGNASVTVSQVTASGTGFSVSGVSTPATLAPAQSLALKAQFSPASGGAASGSISIATTQGTSLSVSLSGTGLQPGLSLLPASISFGNVVVGTTNSQTVKITNSGNASLTISQATLTGSGFSTSGLTTPLTLAAGQASTFTVLFAPPAAGSASGSLALTSNAPNSPASIPLSGSGVTATYKLSVSPVSLSFGNVNTGSSASQSVSIANTGNSNVTISQISVSGAGFSATGVGAPVTLSPSQSVKLTVQFSPSTAGSVSGTISVLSNASGSPAAISVTGTGVTPAVAHSVALTWNASSSTVSGYNVYRSMVSGSSYAKVNSTLLSGMTYTDGTVQSAQTYYYVTTAVDASGTESTYSNEVQAVIP